MMKGHNRYILIKISNTLFIYLNYRYQLIIWHHHYYFTLCASYIFTIHIYQVYYRHPSYYYIFLHHHSLLLSLYRNITFHWSRRRYKNRWRFFYYPRINIILIITSFNIRMNILLPHQLSPPPLSYLKVE